MRRTRRHNSRWQARLRNKSLHPVPVPIAYDELRAVAVKGKSVGPEVSCSEREAVGTLVYTGRWVARGVVVRDEHGARLPPEWQLPLARCGRGRARLRVLPREGELYVWVQSQARVHQERAMRRRQLQRLWKRLQQLQRQRPSDERLLLKLGAAQQEAGRARALGSIVLPDPTPKMARYQRVDFSFALNKAKLRIVRRREGRYLLRSNLSGSDPAQLWEFYLQLVEVEAAFKDLKSDLVVRPIFHQVGGRIEAHIFVAFLAYCLQVSLKEKLRRRAPGLTPRQALEKLGAMQLLDVHFPTTDGRELIFTRHTEPEKDQQLVLAQLGWKLPPQLPPRLTANRQIEM